MEIRIMNLLNFQTLVASKACRSVLVAGEKPLLDYRACAARMERIPASSQAVP
jgi:nicotinic acid phosphoribosyltransferase